MQDCAVAAMEQARLAALYQLEILDTAPEPEFDELVQIAAAICGAPISVISLVDEDRQWFKAAVGVNLSETPRDLSFCDHTIRSPGMLMVENALEDSRFEQNVFVTATSGWRFYAGVPLADPEGQPVGTLCVMDHVPRTLTKEQQTALRVLAAQVNARLELRVQRRAVEAALAEAEAARARLAASEQRFQMFMDSGPFLGYLKDQQGRMLYYNRTFAQRFDVNRDFLLNKTDAELWPRPLAEKYRQHDLIALQSGDLHVVEEETENPDGSVSVWRSYKFPFADAAGQQLLGGVSIDVTEELRREGELRRYQEELEAANRRLSDLASVDALTGLANRRVLDERLRTEFRLARNHGQHLAVMMLDVDDFKARNDEFGHLHGDQVLRQLGSLLQSSMRASDLAARFGGEEFVLLMPGTNPALATEIAERLLTTIRRQTWPERPLTVSIGISSLCPATPDAQRLLTLADEAVYCAKRAGKDRALSYQHIYEQALANTRGKLREAKL